MNFADLDEDTLEGKILYYITKVHKEAILLQRLQEEYAQNRTRLRLLINMFKDRQGEASADDLVAAIIKDDALHPEDICFAFSFDRQQDFIECINRINQRNETKR
jgi:hypothetical protein